MGNLDRHDRRDGYFPILINVHRQSAQRNIPLIPCIISRVYAFYMYVCVCTRGRASCNWPLKEETFRVLPLMHASASLRTAIFNQVPLQHGKNCLEGEFRESLYLADSSWMGDRDYLHRLNFRLAFKNSVARWSIFFKRETYTRKAMVDACFVIPMNRSDIWEEINDKRKKW